MVRGARWLFVILLLGVLLGLVQAAPKEEKPLSGKKVLFVVAPKNFRDEELLETEKILSGYGAKSTLASTTKGNVVGMLGAVVRPNALLSEVDPKDYDVVVFVGGSGCPVLWDNEDAHRIAQEAYKAGKLVAAICLAPVILARAGLLKDCKATVFETAKGELVKGGAKYVEKSVVRCGRIITANGPKAVRRFAEAIKEALTEKPQQKPSSESK